MLWTWFFIMLYTVAVFVILSQYVYKNMVVKLDFFFVEIWYDVWGCFRILTIFYFFIVNLYFSFYWLDSSRFNRLSFFKGQSVYKIGVWSFKKAFDVSSLIKALKGYYFLFNFFLVWPSLFVAASNFPFLWNIWKIVLWVSPILFYFLCFFIVDFIWSDRIVRKIFKWKDADIWNCPVCHEYILKKPVFYCSNCWMTKYREWKLLSGKYCIHCWFKSCVDDFDFPKYCPHCGLRFK